MYDEAIASVFERPIKVNDSFRPTRFCEIVNSVSSVVPGLKYSASFGRILESIKAFLDAFERSKAVEIGGLRSPAVFCGL
jgi:hypothetical protein